MESSAQIAVAMNRVLDAERAAQAAIAECGAQGKESLERARHQARSILEHAHARIIALHTNSAQPPGQPPVAQEQRVQPTGIAAAGPPPLVRFEAALASVADALLNARLEEM